MRWLLQAAVLVERTLATVAVAAVQAVYCYRPAEL
jgi:hypothetical protein